MVRFAIITTLPLYLFFIYTPCHRVIPPPRMTCNSLICCAVATRRYFPSHSKLLCCDILCGFAQICLKVYFLKPCRACRFATQITSCSCPSKISAAELFYLILTLLI